MAIYSSSSLDALELHSRTWFTFETLPLPYAMVGVWILGFVVCLIVSIGYPNTVFEMPYFLD